MDIGFNYYNYSIVTFVSSISVERNQRGEPNISVGPGLVTTPPGGRVVILRNDRDKARLKPFFVGPETKELPCPGGLVVMSKQFKLTTKPLIDEDQSLVLFVCVSFLPPSLCYHQHQRYK